MKKAVLLIVTVAVVISLSGCAGRQDRNLPDATDSIIISEPADSIAEGFDTGADINRDVEAEVTSAAIQEDSSMESDVEEHSHILIAYFTWAENTYVENPEVVDVDATTSASVLPPGNAAKMAGWIQEEICFLLL